MSDLVIPEMTLGWRLKLSLAQADMGQQEMADELGVSRATVSAWLNDRGAPPRKGFMKLWAMRCGVPLEWLTGGDAGIRIPGSFPAADLRLAA